MHELIKAVYKNYMRKSDLYSRLYPFVLLLFGMSQIILHPNYAIAIITFFLAIILIIRYVFFSAYRKMSIHMHIISSFSTVFHEITLNHYNFATDRTLFTFIFHDLHVYEKQIEQNTSLTDDFKTLFNLRQKCLHVAPRNKEMFEILSNLCLSLEKVIQNKHNFYSIKVYLYNRKNRLNFQRKIQEKSVLKN